jgi:bifunctional non-homologous end joining protein LigD
LSSFRRPMRPLRPIPKKPSPKVRKQAKPGFVEFCDPTLRAQAPSGDQWAYEIKADGYRAQLHLNHGEVVVYSRSGYDSTTQYSAIAKAGKQLRAQSAILDGEAVAMGSTNLPDFQALRRELRQKHPHRLVYLVFDLLYLDGLDLRSQSYIERKEKLWRLLSNGPSPFSYVEYLEGDGREIYRHACRLGYEGLVCKRKDSPYRSGRQEFWIKLKCKKSDTFPIVAFVEKLGAKPRRIASLYVGRQDDGRTLYAGKVGTGYTHAVAQEVRERLDPLIVRRSPLSVAVNRPKATWVEPVVQAEVEYGGLTDDGLLREAVFKGLRDDLLPPETVAVPKPRRTHKPHVGVPRENILQLLPDAVVPSKEELRSYWGRVWKRALPYLERRPLKFVRHVHGTTFYHMGPLPEIPSAVHQLTIEKREGGQGTRLWVDTLDGFLGLVDIGAVELHPWNATVDDIERADQIVFDIDPGEGIAWDFVVETAFRLRQVLEHEELQPWAKLTGGKGLHVMASLPSPVTHDHAHSYARNIVHHLAHADPRRYVTSAAPERRAGRIFLDYLRNGRGTTAIGTYSPRAREGFPVAAPITWTQLQRGTRPDAYSITSPFRAAVAHFPRSK